MYTIEFFRLRIWTQSKYAPSEFLTETEACRAASVRSVNSGMTYRVMRDGKTLSEWRNGNQVSK